MKNNTVIFITLQVLFLFGIYIYYVNTVKQSLHIELISVICGILFTLYTFRGFLKRH